jgi:dienelactone hydrolase
MSSARTSVCRVRVMSIETIMAPSGPVPTYVATPSTGGPWPAVVLVHDFTGMSHDLRDQADWLAGAGFLAAAPDLFHWGGRGQMSADGDAGSGDAAGSKLSGH